MQMITGVFNIVGRGYVITLDKDDNYQLEQKIEISIDGEYVTTATINGIERARVSIGVLKTIGLQIKGENLNNICKGMLIEKCL